jgi:predicted nucleotidyltransferase
MNSLNTELIKLLHQFEKQNVHYLIIGGLATNRYGYHRITGDVDLYIKDSIENRKNLIAALEQAGYGKFDSLLTTQIIPGYCEIMMDDGIYADLMTEIPGLNKEDFGEHYEKALIENVDGVTVRFISYDHLIQNKKVTGRPKDLLDVQELERINKK